jgi:hypothetical protein
MVLRSLVAMTGVMGGKQLGFGDYEQTTAKKGLLKKSDQLRRSWFQRSRPGTLAL